MGLRLLWIFLLLQCRDRHQILTTKVSPLAVRVNDLWLGHYNGSHSLKSCTNTGRFSSYARVTEILHGAYFLKSHILLYSTGLPIWQSLPCMLQILKSMMVFNLMEVDISEVYTILKPHTSFYINHLAIWHNFPDITHIKVNNSLKLSILKLIELTVHIPPWNHTFCL